MSRKTRKLIWSAPLVAVLAVAGALAVFVAITPGAALAEHEELPGPVTGLKAEADGRTMMDLSWNAPTTGGDATHYRIDRSDDTYTWKALVVTTDAATTHTDTGLKPARTYYYRVFAVNSSGMGPVSVEENYTFDTTASVEAPGTLRLVSAVGKSDTQIDVTVERAVANRRSVHNQVLYRRGTGQGCLRGSDCCQLYQRFYDRPTDVTDRRHQRR